MDEEEQRGPERDKRAFICHRPDKDAIDEHPGAQVKQEIQQMITGWIETIQQAIDHESRIQHRTHHVIEMADEGVPVREMRIFENRERVVVVEIPVEGSGIDNPVSYTHLTLPT